MIGQRMMVGQQDGSWSEWRIHVDTGTLKKTGIPITLYGQPEIVLKVDWGDGSTSTLNSDSYSKGDTSASVHDYANDGIYEVVLHIKNCEELFLSYEGIQISSDNLYNRNIKYFRNTLISVDSAIPLVAGIQRYYRQDWDRRTGELTRLFYYCEKLTSLSIDTFYNNPQITNVGYQFNNSPVGNFALRFSAEGITSAEEFCTNASSGITRTVYVPSGSTTESTFNSIASSKGITVIGE